MPKVVAQKSEWIELGFDLFTKYGISGVNVEKMAEKLKCNRSSFYWHFNSKKEFIDQIIEAWKKTDTNQIIQLTEQANTPEKQLEVLVKTVFKKDPNIDFVFYLKRYALQQTKVQTIIDEVDKFRIQYVATLLQNLGSDAEEARTKAQVFYKYLIGYHEMIRYKKQSKNYVQQVYEELKYILPQ
ncbi:MAG: TetR/AcrR family transcriptional regulator [Bacteroidota bacterium]